jgi:hypothetical protein
MELKTSMKLAWIISTSTASFFANIAIATPQTVRPKFPLETAMSHEEMVGKYKLVSVAPNIGNCSSEIMATTRDASNDSSVWQIGVVGFSAKATNDGLRIEATSQQSMALALKPMDPGMSFRFGNEFAEVRCSGFSCNEYDGEVWLARTAFQRNGSIIVEETIDGNTTLSCRYTKVVAPNTAMRGTWGGSLYPTSVAGSYSHFYNAKFDISCTDDAKIEGTAILETRSNANVYDRVFAILGGTCAQGQPATVLVYANLLKDGQTRVQGPFRMNISSVVKSGNSKYWKNENFSVNVFDSTGELFGEVSKPTAKDVYRNL